MQWTRVSAGAKIANGHVNYMYAMSPYGIYIIESNLPKDIVCIGYILVPSTCLRDHYTFANYIFVLFSCLVIRATKGQSPRGQNVVFSLCICNQWHYRRLTHHSFSYQAKQRVFSMSVIFSHKLTCVCLCVWNYQVCSFVGMLFSFLYDGIIVKSASACIVFDLFRFWIILT